MVRRRLPDGSATDVIGWLTALTSDVAVLTTPDQTEHHLDRSSIVVARRAPAAAGGPDPRRAVSADALEQHALRGWIAEHEALGEWTLRAGGGFTARANSCLAVGDPGVEVGEAALRIAAYAARYEIPPMAQVVLGSDADTALRRLGWTETHHPGEVLTVRLADLLGTSLPDSRVRVGETLDNAWWGAFRLSRPASADPAVVRQILECPTRRAYASAGDGDEVSWAIGRGHLSDQWLGISSLWTRPDHRESGWATAVVGALGHWAARLGARYAYLQAPAGAERVKALYERLGFAGHHRYGYLRPR